MIVGLGAFALHSIFKDQWTDNIVKVDCGTSKLEIIRQNTRIGTIGVAKSYVLTRKDGAGERVVSRTVHPEKKGLVCGTRCHQLRSPSSPEIFTGYTFDGRGNAWNVWVDARKFSHDEFEEIASCLKTNLLKVDAAFNRFNDPAEKIRLVAVALDELGLRQ